MIADVTDNQTQAAGANWGRLWRRIAFIGAASAFAIWAIVFAPRMWRAAERLKAEQVDQENGIFCEKFRMPPGSESFATCVMYLTEVRRRHGDRIAAEAAGIL
ncbi:MAG: hypothetical protein QOF41_2526 [Methylobacteriaceae bacterium]|jgi:hypothetical protein|nr:hypothetical protein [Methylobacteriaceae bacterium]